MSRPDLRHATRTAIVECIAKAFGAQKSTVVDAGHFWSIYPKVEAILETRLEGTAQQLTSAEWLAVLRNVPTLMTEDAQRVESRQTASISAAASARSRLTSPSGIDLAEPNLSAGDPRIAAIIEMVETARLLARLQALARVAGRDVPVRLDPARLPELAGTEEDFEGIRLLVDRYDPE